MGEKKIKGNGKAPCAVADTVFSLAGIKAALRLVGEMCEEVDLEGWEGGFFQNAIKGAIDHPKVLCDESIKNLIEAYPEDEGLKKYQPKTEELEE